MSIYRTLILAGVVALSANAAMAAGGGHGGRGGDGNGDGGRNGGPDGRAEERIRDQGLNIAPPFYTQTRTPEVRGDYPVRQLPRTHR